LDRYDLINFRAMREWSQERMAHNMRYSLRHYAGLESGERNVCSSVRKRLEKIGN
jgi:transcriptional regulator with XRE-family HTH domain